MALRNNLSIPQSAKLQKKVIALLVQGLTIHYATMLNGMLWWQQKLTVHITDREAASPRGKNMHKDTRSQLTSRMSPFLDSVSEDLVGFNRQAISGEIPEKKGAILHANRPKAPGKNCTTDTHVTFLPCSINTGI